MSVESRKPPVEETSRFSSMKKEIERHGEVPSNLTNSTQEERNKEVGLKELTRAVEAEARFQDTLQELQRFEELIDKKIEFENVQERDLLGQSPDQVLKPKLRENVFGSVREDIRNQLDYTQPSALVFMDVMNHYNETLSQEDYDADSSNKFKVNQVRRFEKVLEDINTYVKSTNNTIEKEVKGELHN